jgi:TPR repeat protein
LFNAFASAIQIPNNRTTTAKIQITRLLVKLEKAFKFFQKACDLNNGSGCSNLGVMHEKGKGVKPCLTPLPSSYINPRLEQPLPSFKSHAFW